MAEEGLRARAPRAARYSSYAGEEGRAAAPNLLLVDAGRDLHDFSAAAPGEVLVTDITEFRLPDDPRKVYLSPAVDLFDGDVAAFSVGTSPSKALVAEMLAGAVAAAGGGFTLHSDRGWHYRTPDWVRACGEAGVERSMSRKGHSPDNAACEGFFGRLKVEFFHGRDWRGVSAERFAAELAEWIRWYREGRLKAFDEGGAQGVRYDSRPQEAAGAGRLGRPEKRPHPRCQRKKAISLTLRGSSFLSPRISDVREFGQRVYRNAEFSFARMGIVLRAFFGDGYTPRAVMGVTSTPSGRW